MSVRINFSVSKNKKTQANWPLSSKSTHSYDVNTIVSKKPIRKIICMRGTSSFYSDENPKLDILAYKKNISVTIQRGTKKITPFQNSIEDSTYAFPQNKKHICSTCQKEIDNEISRVLIMRDKDGGPCLLIFHFFFPCWDLNQLCQKYPNLIIDKLAFSFPDGISMKENSKKDLLSDLDFWK